MPPILRPGSVGPDVGTLHQLLTEDGLGIAPAELAAARFGDSTQQAVEDWQARHTDSAGRPLAVDGVVGPATWWALQHPAQALAGGPAGYMVPGWHLPAPSDCPGDPATQAAIYDALQAAQRDMSAHEEPDGSNDGPRLAKFHTQGRAWCALAVSTWLAQRPLGSPWGLVAGVIRLREWGAAHGRLVAPAQLLPGDVAGLLRAGGHGHCWLVVTPPDGAGNHYTLAGNEGDAVRAAQRNIATVTFGVRPWAPVP